MIFNHKINFKAALTLISIELKDISYKYVESIAKNIMKCLMIKRHIDKENHMNRTIVIHLKIKFKRDNTKFLPHSDEKKNRWRYCCCFT